MSKGLIKVRWQPPSLKSLTSVFPEAARFSEVNVCRVIESSAVENATCTGGFAPSVVLEHLFAPIRCFDSQKLYSS